MDDISDLLKEAKPLYFRRKRIRNLTKAAGVLSIAVFLAFGTFQRADNYVYDFDNMSSTISMLQNGSAIEDLGLPTDEYGFLRIS
ncbi:MAG: hypothetical protein MSB80_02655 [Alphaproteobacteria bacterium]|nr:hypothetical protein [Alphaproteobacteria bacterium]